MSRHVYLHGNTTLEIQQALNRLVDQIIGISPEPIETITKAVIVQLEPNSSFPANPLLITAVFDPPFVDNQYAVEAQIVGGNGNYEPLRIINKLANKCTIILSSDGATDLPDSIDVIAREAIIEEFGGYSTPIIVPSQFFDAPRYLWVNGGAITYTGMFVISGVNNSFSPPAYIYTQIGTPENQLTVIFNGTQWAWQLTSPHAAPGTKIGNAGPVGIYNDGSVVTNVKYELTGFPSGNGEYLFSVDSAGSFIEYTSSSGGSLFDYLPSNISQGYGLTSGSDNYGSDTTNPVGQWHSNPLSIPVAGIATPTQP